MKVHRMNLPYSRHAITNNAEFLNFPNFPNFRMYVPFKIRSNELLTTTSFHEKPFL